MRKPGVGVLVAYLGGHRRAVAGMNAVTAYSVDGIPHHGRHGGAWGEAPVCRIWQSERRCVSVSELVGVPEFVLNKEETHSEVGCRCRR